MFKKMCCLWTEIVSSCHRFWTHCLYVHFKVFFQCCFFLWIFHQFFEKLFRLPFFCCNGATLYRTQRWIFTANCCCGTCVRMLRPPEISIGASGCGLPTVQKCQPLFMVYFRRFWVLLADSVKPPPYCLFVQDDKRVRYEKDERMSIGQPVTVTCIPIQFDERAYISQMGGGWPPNSFVGRWRCLLFGTKYLWNMKTFEVHGWSGFWSVHIICSWSDLMNIWHWWWSLPILHHQGWNEYTYISICRLIPYHTIHVYLVYILTFAIEINHSCR